MSSSTATPDMAMNPTPAEIENGMSRSHEGKDSADPGERNAGKDSQGIRHVAIGEVQQT